MISNEQKVEMFKMRVEGVSLAEIGDTYGVSKQAVQQMLGSYVRNPKEVGRKNKCIYPTLVKWCNEKEISLRRLSILAGISVQTFYRDAEGKGSFSQAMIDRILAVTGLTYEEAFRREGLK